MSGILIDIALPGAVPVVGGSSDPSVLRSPGATPQKGRAAHGPRHPAVTSSSETMLFLCQVSCVRVLWNIVGFYVWGS